MYNCNRLTNKIVTCSETVLFV